MSRALSLLLVSALALPACSSGSMTPGGDRSAGLAAPPGGALAGGGSRADGPSGGTPPSGFLAGGPAGGSNGNLLAGGPSRSDPVTQAACRDRVNQMYERRNRADIYTPNSSINTPFSANYQPGSTDRGLADRFAYDGTINECLRGGTAGSGRAGGEVSSPPPPSTRGR